MGARSPAASPCLVALFCGPHSPVCAAASLGGLQPPEEDRGSSAEGGGPVTGEPWAGRAESSPEGSSGDGVRARGECCSVSAPLRSPGPPARVASTPSKPGPLVPPGSCVPVGRGGGNSSDACMLWCSVCVLGTLHVEDLQVLRPVYFQSRKLGSCSPPSSSAASFETSARRWRGSMRGRWTR